MDIKIFQDKVIENKKTGFKIGVSKEDTDYFSNYYEFYAALKDVAINQNQDVKNIIIKDRLKKVTQMLVDKEISEETAVKLVKNEKKNKSNKSNSSDEQKLKPKGI